MVDLEEVERSLATQCSSCCGRGVFLSTKPQDDQWCMWCGGSGLERTRRRYLYELQLVQERAAPYLFENPELLVSRV